MRRRTRNLPYNPILRERARELRKNMTLAEILLWKQLKGKQRLGHDFHRQKPIDEYIVDFFCLDLMLAIEIDGRSHDHKRERDEARQRRLETLGVRFLRFWDSEVKSDMAGVVARIDEWILKHGDADRGDGG